MKRGAVLQLQFQNGRSIWRCDGAFVVAEIAAAVIVHPDIVGCGDALFPRLGLRGQFGATWRRVGGGKHDGQTQT